MAKIFIGLNLRRKKKTVSRWREILELKFVEIFILPYWTFTLNLSIAVPSEVGNFLSESFYNRKAFERKKKLFDLLTTLQNILKAWKCG